MTTQDLEFHRLGQGIRQWGWSSIHTAVRSDGGDEDFPVDVVTGGQVRGVIGNPGGGAVVGALELLPSKGSFYQL